MTTEPVSHGYRRRAVLGIVALGAVGTPIVVAQRWAHAGTAASGSGLANGLAPAAALAPKAAQLLWSPNPATDGLGAFEGIEADRANRHPGRKYIYVEDDHYRFDIYKDDLDSTGGGDRQRTECKGMVAKGSALKMRDNETWRITYEMYMPSTLHGTSRFTHIFQLKTPATNGGPWTTLSLHRSGSSERITLQADSTSGAPTIGATDLAPLRNKWITVELTFKIGPSGTARLVLRNGTGSTAPVVVDASHSGLKIPAQGDYVRPKWGIYRSIQSASSDIIDTHLLTRNYQAYKGT